MTRGVWILVITGINFQIMNSKERQYGRTTNLNLITKQHPMYKRYLFLILIIVALPAYGQVVIPSLDPAQPTELSSALAWRIGSTYGIESESFNRDEDASHDAGAENIRSSILLAYQPGNVVGELYYVPYLKTREITYGSGYTSIEWKDDDASYLALRLAIRGNRQVSVGIGYSKSEATLSYFDEKYEASYYEGSFSVRMLDGLFFAAGGLQRVTVNLGSSDSMKYNTVVSGVALQFGEPNDMILKKEASYKITPKTESENGTMGTLPKTTVSQFNMDFMSGILFASYQFSNALTEEAFGSDDNKSEMFSRYGLGLKLGSMTIGLYRKAWQIEYGDNYIDFDTYQATLGLSFL